MSKSFRQDLTGKRFGRLTVFEFVPNDKPRACWRCKCECGTICIVEGSKLTNFHTQSCGCLSKELSKKRLEKHKSTNTRLYNIWCSMKERCLNPRARQYKDWGERGITICSEWKNDFAIFKDWALANGYADNLTIDRIDVDGNYEPSNCRWVDMTVQNSNKRNNIVVEYLGARMTLINAAELSGITLGILHNRYYRGDRGDRLFRPVRK